MPEVKRERVKGPLKFHGGKTYLASQIWDIAEPIIGEIVHCVEGCCGGARWAIEGWNRGYEKSFVLNDLDKDVSNFWMTLQSKKQFDEFHRLCEMTPFSELEHDRVDIEFLEWPKPDWEVMHRSVRAWQFFVLCRQSLAGRMKAFTSITRNRTRGKMNAEASAWLSSIEGLPQVHRMLREMVVLCRDCVKLIDTQDGPKTLFYFDPPYLPETRVSKEVYREEMTTEQHVALLQRLETIEGKFMLSGYDSFLYEKFARRNNWNVHEFGIANHASGGKSKRRMREMLWTNFKGA